MSSTGKPAKVVATAEPEDPFPQVMFKQNVWRKGADEKRDHNYIHFTAFEQNVIVEHLGQLQWVPFVQKVLKDDECSITVFNFTCVVVVLSSSSSCCVALRACTEPVVGDR